MTNSLNKTFNIFGIIGQIDIKAFPIPPTPPVGFEWENGGEVQLIPIEDYEPDYLHDAVMTSTNAYHEECIFQNITHHGYDYSQEPAWVVYDEKSEKFIGKTGRTRAKVFSQLNEPLYPVRVMKFKKGYNEGTASFNAAVWADISHKPARSPKWTALADALINLRIQNIPWYEGQIKNQNGTYIYGEVEFKHWFYYVTRLNIRYDESIFTKMFNRIKILVGNSSKSKVVLKTKPQIAEELSDSENDGKNSNPLFDESDGYEVSIVCMDDAQANAPAKLKTILRFHKENPGRFILYTKRCQDDTAIHNLRESYAAALRRTAREFAQFFLKDEIPEKYYQEIVDQKVDSLFDNFELYSYNHMKEVEEDLVRIAI